MAEAESCEEAVTAAPPSCRGDLGYQLGMLLRDYQRLAATAFEDIPGGQRGFQAMLAAREGAGAAQATPNQATIATQLGLDRTVMTYLLDELVAAGLVERRPDPADRRARLILLTPAGDAALAGLWARLRELERELLGDLRDDEFDQFTALLARAGRTQTA